VGTGTTVAISAAEKGLPLGSGHALLFATNTDVRRTIPTNARAATRGMATLPSTIHDPLLLAANTVHLLPDVRIRMRQTRTSCSTMAAMGFTLPQVLRPASRRPPAAPYQTIPVPRVRQCEGREPSWTSRVRRRFRGGRAGQRRTMASVSLETRQQSRRDRPLMFRPRDRRRLTLLPLHIRLLPSCPFLPVIRVRP
jgi:hypothetical protein